MTGNRKTFIVQMLKVLLGSCLVVLLFFIARNFSIYKPLLIDESITAWLVTLNYGQLIQEVFLNQGSSPLYFLTIKLWSQIVGGQGTVALKLFSVLLALISLIYILRSFRLIFSVTSSLIALVLIISIKSQFTLAILPIRPYSLVTFCLAIATYYYLRFLSEARNSHKPDAGLQICFVFFFLATICHYFFLAIWAVSLCHYLIYFRNRAETKQVLTYNLILLLLLGAFFPHYQQILGNASEWAQSLESGGSLLKAYYLPFASAPYSLMLMVVVALLLHCNTTALRELKSLISAHRTNALLTYALSMFLGLPMIYYLLREVLNLQVYVHRYYFWYLIFGAMSIALLFRVLESKSRVIALLLSIILVGELIVSEAKTRYFLPDFQEASRQVNILNRPELPVLFHSGLVESYDPEMLFDERKEEYFYSYLSIYPIVNHERYLLPPNLVRPEFVRYFDRTILPKINQQGEFLIYTSGMKIMPKAEAMPIPEFYYRFFQELGWSSEIINSDPGVAIIHLKRKAR